MVFSSLSFLFFFIPITCVLYFAFPNRKVKNTVLLLASLLFYSWGEPHLILLMILVAFISYAGGIATEKLNDLIGCANLRRIVQILTVTLIASSLFIFKYLNFFVENINSLFGLNVEIASISLPIGISFYTFQVLSYNLDLYKGEVKVQKNYFYLLLYVSFFPQLIAGPIVRYATVEDEINNRKENIDDISYGIRRFIIGLTKKVIISNGVAQFSELVYAGDPEIYGSLMYWLAAFAYTLQIYYDFSGYSDMAIGLGRIFGFHFLENFDHPYVATSVTDFWRRWHISLSTWFRDYIYIPLGGNRVDSFRWIFNIMFVWALTGLWHGASWNFVLWGMYYGVILVIEKLYLRKILDKCPKIIGWVYTIFIVICGWTLFNLTDPIQLKLAFRQMFIYVSSDLLKIYSTDIHIAQYSIYMIVGTIFMFPIGHIFRNISDKPIGNIISWIWHILLLIVCVVYLLSNSYNPFIYFRF